MPTIKEMRQVCQLRRVNSKGKMVLAGNWFNRSVTRAFSIYLTWLFVTLHVSANQVTLLMILCGLGGFALSVPHILWLNLIGAPLLFLGEILDCVDGEVARWTKKSSLRGVYLDLVNHVLCNAAATATCGLHLYLLYGQNKYLILAFWAYAMSQIRLGLREAYYRVRLQIPQQAHADAHNDSESKRQQAGPGNRWISLFVFLIDVPWNGHVVRIATVAAILVLYAGIEWPIIFLTWWFVIYGAICNAREIVSKYFGHVPDVSHVKKV